MVEHPYKVFISHASGDLGVARLIRGYEDYVQAEFIIDDEGVRAGEEFRPRLTALIRTSRELLLLVSPLALESHWLSWELGVAEGQDLTIVPLLHGVDLAQINGNRKWRHLIGQRSALEIKEVFTYFEQLRSRVTEHGIERLAGLARRLDADAATALARQRKGERQ